MTSPARRHFARVTAAIFASQAVATQPQGGDAFELMRASLVEDRRRLSDIQSIQKKIELKAELLPAYEAYVDGILEAGQGAQDEVLMTLMVWYFDIGHLDRGLDIAAYALNHKLETPDRYQRGTASLVAEECAENALRQIEEHPDPDALLEQLTRVDDLVAGADMHDQIRAKVNKAIGYVLRRIEQPLRALQYLQKALELDGRIGVKKDIERLERELKKSAGATSA